jgi:hypothetical protein
MWLGPIGLISTPSGYTSNTAWGEERMWQEEKNPGDLQIS